MNTTAESSSGAPERTPRVVVVTGANRGIGYAIAERLVAAGDAVASIHRSGQLPDGVLSVKADIRDTEAVDAAFTQIESDLGPVQVLIANAGITKDTLLMRMSDDDFTQVLDVNLAGTFRCVRRASKPMIRGRYGRIVLISSVVGLYGSPGQVNYAASKSALVGMARSVTRELGGRGITCNVVAPGFIDTAMTAELPEATQASYRAAIPAGRFAQPQEVAAAVEFVASDEAAYITGAVIPVDGGLGMGH
ncbi:MAG: 3-oxoacyl-ACP reductase FabG [Beutenbergiaceae bacterium]